MVAEAVLPFPLFQRGSLFCVSFPYLPASRPLTRDNNDLIRAAFPLFSWHIADTASVTYDRVYAWLEKLQWR